MRRFFAFLGIIITVLVVTAVTAGNASAAAASSPTRAAATMHRDALSVAPDQATIILYGDSLASEAQGYFRDALAAAGVGNVRTSTFGGTAICDWLDRMRSDAATLHPTAVVVEFSGNALTPCMLDGQGQSFAVALNAYYRKYVNDAREVLRIFTTSGTRVYFAGAPKTRVAEETNDLNAGLLNTTYADLAAETPDARFVGAGDALLHDGHWTETLPCLASEPCTGGADANGRGINVVRAPDGGHFCPGAPGATRGVTGTCPVWSSGAFRYGNAMAAAVIRDLGAGEPANLSVALRG
jgi:hypothetical protein